MCSSGAHGESGPVPMPGGARLRLLLIDTAKAESARLRAVLDRLPFDVTHAAWPGRMDALAAPVHAVLLHVLVPDQRLKVMLKGIRLLTPVPLLVCSGSDQESHVIAALDAGADDYLLLPMSPAECAARIGAVVRRTSAHRRTSPQRLVAGEFEVRLDEQRAFRNGRPLNLSPIEFRLFATLLREAGNVVGHATLLARVWGPQYLDQRDYLRLYVTYLRSRIEDDPRRPKFILNQRGLGYRFNAEAS